MTNSFSRECEPSLVWLQDWMNNIHRPNLTAFVIAEKVLEILREKIKYMFMDNGQFTF